MRRTPERLERRLARVARKQGLDQERLRRWVSFLAICGALEKAVQQGMLDAYYLKGGAAMELRFALRARATKDLDLGIEGTRATRLQRLSEALGLGFDEFTFRVKAQVRHMDQADTVRVQVAIQHRDPVLADRRSRSWASQRGTSRSDCAAGPRFGGVGYPGCFASQMLGPCRSSCAETPRVHGPSGHGTSARCSGHPADRRVRAGRLRRDRQYGTASIRGPGDPRLPAPVCHARGVEPGVGGTGC